MNFIPVVVVFLLLLIIILLIPIQLSISINEGRMHLSVFKIKLMDQKLTVLVNKENIQKTKLISAMYLKLLTKVNYKGLKLYVEGINYDMEVAPAYFGFIQSGLSIVKGYLSTKDIDFDYKALYMGNAYFEFDGIIELHLGMFFIEFMRIRRVINERESD